MVAIKHLLVASLLQLTTLTAAHSHDSHDNMGVDMRPVSNSTTSTATHPEDPWYLPSYSGLEAHSGTMLAHISFMSAAWFFLLPIGVMLSIARSRWTIPTQILFLTLNGFGIFFGIFYNVNAPDLYTNNAHYKIGWLVTCVVTVQVAMSLLFAFSGRTQKGDAVVPAETTAFLPISIEAMAEHRHLNHADRYKDTRWSRDSGQGTESASSSRRSRDQSPADRAQRSQEYEQYGKCEAEDENDEDQIELPHHREPLRSTFLHRLFGRRLPILFSQRVLKVLEVIYDGIDRVILILSFIALVTGGVTYTGIFRANNIFNGLAHFIKGGIFFWYGLLTLGRWMGCFADLGWAWNIKPSKSESASWKTSVPTAEFTESFLIWLYGTTNVFLEHLAAWGDAWTAQDLEHVSISIMFFGGGLCGMLVESQRVRDWLNTSISLLSSQNDLHSKEWESRQSPPRTYSFSMNPLPALIILLLGLMMSSHHQDSMVSSAVHKQWGTLLVGSSLARGVTYILFFISPPTSLYPSRPPSELVVAFCLISGGLVFMASTKDVIHIMEEHGLMAMFVFTVCMGLTAFIMAYEIVVLAVKGWAIRRENYHPKTLQPAAQFAA